ncbi:Cytochrome b-c1 complex subunit [Lachnellula suecica]|uniref:Cytochrome b-c1 complex subunit 8 n=1 Tax=Lachnellula suecica TaxID=602035 RepID=A0A8T9CE94_9HELO|nr:Cytochrome b-c1 complex subunit [Lachnellula suecica]
MEYNPNPNSRPDSYDAPSTPVLSWGHPRNPKQHGIITYTLSSNKQRPLAGAAHNAVFNTARRCWTQFWYVVPPLAAAWWAMRWAIDRNEFSNSKAGRAMVEYKEGG